MRFFNRVNVPRQAGLSLVELMVSLAISAALMAGLAEVMLGMRQTERSQDALSQMQEAGRFAITFLGDDIRMAGYLGCISTILPQDVNNVLDTPPASFQPSRGIQGWEANGSDPGTVSNSSNNIAVSDTSTGGWGTSGGNVLDSTNVVPATDIIRTWGATDNLTNPGVEIEGVINTVTPPSSPSTFGSINTTVLDIASGDILLLSDCQTADWVQACTVTDVGSPATAMNIALSDTCGPGNTAGQSLVTAAGGNVVKLSGNAYYIGKRGNVATNPPALFRRPIGANGALGTPVELVEGVANIQILYGENTNLDSNNTVDSYLPADQISNWNNVVSVRLSLLVQSIQDNLVPDPMAYTYNRVTYDGTTGNGSLPDDRRLRRVFTTTIGIRNRAL